MNTNFFVDRENAPIKLAVMLKTARRNRKRLNISVDKGKKRCRKPDIKSFVLTKKIMDVRNDRMTMFLW